jgi:hypothetical protein
MMDLILKKNERKGMVFQYPHLASPVLFFKAAYPAKLMSRNNYLFGIPKKYPCNVL